MKITRIPRERDLHKKRVAAYCRVSTLLEEQEESLEAQVKYYRRFIKAHDERCMKIMGMRRVNGHRKEHDTGTCNQYPLGEKLRCPYCGSALYQRAIPVQVKHSAGWCCERGEDACHGFIIRSYLVEAALLEAYGKLDERKIAGKVNSPRFGADAKRALEIKGEHPAFKSVEFWWVDDLIDHIEFGARSKTDREFRRLAAMGEDVTDDRTMKVFWKCGLITTVMSGVASYPYCRGNKPIICYSCKELFAA